MEKNPLQNTVGEYFQQHFTGGELLYWADLKTPIGFFFSFFFFSLMEAKSLVRTLQFLARGAVRGCVVDTYTLMLLSCAGSVKCSILHLAMSTCEM